MSHSLSFGKYFAYILCRKLFNIGQFFVWLINGTFFTVLRSRKEENYHCSAHLQDIIFRHKLDPLGEPAGPRNFITTHCAFVSPSYALQDNVTLYSITPTQAVFVECNEGVDVAHSTNGSFLRDAQYRNARRILTMPISTLHKLADQVGDPEGDIIVLSMTTRCGSTLMCQIFEETGSCVSFSEPDGCNTLAVLIGNLPQDQLDALAKNYIRMQCKKLSNRNVKAFVLKLPASTMNALPLITKLYPNSKQLFMYRDGLTVGQSLHRASLHSSLFCFILSCVNIHPRITERAFGLSGFSATDYRVNVPSGFAFCILVWIVSIHKYMEYRKEGINIHAIRYEDIIQSPLETTKAILKYCNLSDELAEDGIKALKKDSQKNSQFNKDILGGTSVNLEGNDKIFVDTMCDLYGLPRIPQTYILEGTITYKQE